MKAKRTGTGSAENQDSLNQDSMDQDSLNQPSRLHLAVRRMLTDQRGLNTVELVVIIAVVIGLALLFRTRITGFVTTLLDGLFSDRTAAELVRGVSVP